MQKKFDIIRVIISLIVVISLLIVEFTVGDYILTPGLTVNNGIILPISLVIYVLIAYDLYIKAFKEIKSGDVFNEITLTLIATIAAFGIQQYVEGIAVAIFFQIGEMFEDYAVEKSKSNIEKVLQLRPSKATILKEGKEETINIEDVHIGDLLLVKPGERVAVDGKIIKGTSSFDYSPMTGESLPQTKKESDEILSGVINLSSPVVLKTTKESKDSTVSKILDIVENATSAKTKPEKFITHFSKIYTPIVVALAFIIAIIPPLCINYSNPETWYSFIKTGASFLVISCPCALVLSVPMAYFGGISAASKNKVLIKGSHYLELLNKSNTIVFDKTGTITKGNFEINEINPTEKYSQDNLINLASFAEYYSNHPIANVIKKHAKTELNSENLEDYKEISGQGIRVLYNKKLLLAGNEKLMNSNNVVFKKNHSIGTVIYVSYNQDYIGSIVIKDQIKESSKRAIYELSKLGIKNSYMLTGDNKDIAEEIAKTCAITNVYANLLPLDKYEIIKKIKADSANKNVIFVGDGINDSPSLTYADIGISMGGIGSDAAIEASDMVIMDDDLEHLVTTKKISKSTIRIVYENIVFALVIKFAVLTLSILQSFLNLPFDAYIIWLAIFADVGVTIICTLNSLRLTFKNFK